MYRADEQARSTGTAADSLLDDIRAREVRNQYWDILSLVRMPVLSMLGTHGGQELVTVDQAAKHLLNAREIPGGSSGFTAWTKTHVHEAVEGRWPIEHGQTLEKPHIRTASGGRISLVHLGQSKVVIEDVALGLARQIRYAGQCPRYMALTVAEHSVLVSRALPDDQPVLQMLGLMHDAAEAFIGDLVTPIKRLVPMFETIENRLFDYLWAELVESWAWPRSEPWWPMITKRLGGTHHEGFSGATKAVNEADIRMYTTERMAMGWGPWERSEEYPEYPELYPRFMSEDMSTTNFLARFEELKAKIIA